MFFYLHTFDASIDLKKYEMGTDLHRYVVYGSEINLFQTCFRISTISMSRLL